MRALALLALLLAACGQESPPRVGPPARHEIRPTDGTGWNNNGYGSVTVSHHDSPGGKFRVHYTLEGTHAVPATDADSDGTPDYVSELALVFDQVYAKEITDLGFWPPLDDSVYHDRPDYGGDGRFDVYLQDIQNGDGYVVVEACKPNVPYQCAGYMMVENDFAGLSYPTPHDGMEVVASHEFFHVIQNAYRTDLARTFSEATAVWATEQVFPQQQDYEKFIASYFKEPDRSLDDDGGPPSDTFPYGLAVWPAFLSQHYGARLLPAIFEELSDKGSSVNDLDAIDKVLARDQKSSLAEAFTTFALWNLMTGTRAPGFSGYADATSYPELAVQAVQGGALPLRITDEIAYLSARYYRISVAKGSWIKVTSERPQPKLALHLVTWPAADKPTVVSGAVDEALEIASAGEVLIVAASTARSDNQLPLSLAVTESTPPSPPPNPSDAADDGGCALAPRNAGGAWISLFLLLLVFRQAQRRRGGLDAPRTGRYARHGTDCIE